MKYILLILLSVSPKLLSLESHELIVWNVGQGQFISYIEPHRCTHFDMGGEFFLSERLLLKKCQLKPNILNLTHWDNDHINLISKLHLKLPSLCLNNAPKNLIKSKKYQLKLCSQEHSTIAVIKPEALTSRELTPNERSYIYIVAGKALIPGDSTKELERFWVNQLPIKNSIQILIAGHHGSHTSTGAQLLKSIPHLKTVITSSRKKKYGHPHGTTKKSLKYIRKLKLFTTESYGNLIIKL